MASSYHIPALATDGANVIALCERDHDPATDGGHIDIEARVSDDNGATWGAAQVVASDGVNCFRNPCVIGDAAASKFHLLYCSQIAAANEGAIRAGTHTVSVWYTFSDDGGATWETPTDITSAVRHADWRWYATGPGAGIVLASGRLLCGGNHSDPAYGGGSYPDKAHAIFSDDGGATWDRSSPFGPVGANETTVAQLDDDRLIASSRNQVAAFRIITYSSDEGDTWGTSTVRGDMPGVATEGAMLSVGSDLLHSGIFQSNRQNVSVWRSLDGGATWAGRGTVYSAGSSYSSMCLLPNGKVGVFYAQDQDTTMRFVDFDLAPPP